MHKKYLKQPRQFDRIVLIALSCLFALYAVDAQVRPDPDWSLSKDSVSVVSAPTVNVYAPVDSKSKPSTFVVPITVDDISAIGVFAFQFNIVYNPAVIDPSGPNFGCSTAGTLAGAAGLSPTCNVLPDGTLRVSVSGVSAMTGAGTILNVTFTTDAAANEGDVSPLTFQNSFFFNSSGAVANAPTNGQITILRTTAAGASLAGCVVDANGRPVPRVQVFLADTDSNVRLAITNGFGFYVFSDVPTGSVYVLSASSKKFVFQPRVVSLMGDLSGVDLTAEP